MAGKECKAGGNVHPKNGNERMVIRKESSAFDTELLPVREAGSAIVRVEKAVGSVSLADGRTRASFGRAKLTAERAIASSGSGRLTDRSVCSETEMANRRGCVFYGFLALFLILSVSFLKAPDVRAASINVDSSSGSTFDSTTVTRKVYDFKNGSGSYLVQKGENWYLRDADGNALTGLQYLAISKTGSLMRGYYMFNDKGRLIQENAVYYLNTTVNGLKFKGYYYTSSYGRFRTNATGLVEISNLKCNSKTFDGYYYVQEYGKLTATAQVRLISNTKVNGVTFNGYYYFGSAGKLSTTQKFRQVKQTIGSTKFNGKYFFGGTNGVLIRQAGWVTYNGYKYYINASGKMMTDCWKNGYYLLSNGRIATSQQVADGSYVDADGHKCEAEEMVLSGLKNTISSMVSQYGGTWSVYVKNLETGDVLNLNETAMYPASTIKAFVMATVYNEIAAGRMSETSTVTSLLTSMITVSSNEAYNELVRRLSSSGSFLSGASVVNSYLKANGYTSTSVHHTLHPSSSTWVSDGSRNTSSAKDCGDLLESIYNGTCVSRAYSQKMLNLLLNQKRRTKIPAGVPSGIKVANKTGETSTTQHDIAIVFGAKADYVICVFSTGCSETTAVAGIQSISKTVYEYLN